MVGVHFPDNVVSRVPLAFRHPFHGELGVRQVRNSGQRSVEITRAHNRVLLVNAAIPLIGGAIRSSASKAPRSTSLSK